jgi:large subunit ribosomal protein L25
MSKTLSLQVSQRSGIGRTALKAVRKAGRVPGVLYGKSKDQAVNSRPIEIDAKKLASILHSSTSENVLVDVELQDAGGKKVDSHLALLQDVQHHPLKDYIIHIDLHEIAQDEILHAEEEVVAVPATDVKQPEVIMEKKVDEAAPAAGAKGGKADAKAPAKPEGKK